jgi:LacI family transcriptional regulator
MQKTNSPTMKDVAREAGVSLGTVSKVINGIAVREEYKKKVETAIASLHYEVNTYARGLKTQKTGLIAVIIPTMLNPFFAAYADYLENALYKKGLKMMLCCSDGIPEKEITYLNLATQNKVDGIIALTYSDIGNYISPDLPIVVFDRCFENRNIPRVGSDNYAGGMMAIETLLELGCHHPVYIRFHSIFPGESDKRKEGYLAACKKYHLEPDYLDMEDCDDTLEQMKKFIDQHKKADGSLSFDGVFCHTDYHGYHFTKLLRKEGYRVPEDVQLIGFDGIRKFGGPNEELFVSSIRQPIEKLAAKCVEIVTETDRSSIPSLTLLPVTFEAGGTTRPKKN